MCILILLYLIFYFILAKIRLDWAVMFLIVALPSYLIRFRILGIPFTLLEAMILISFAVWFFGDYKKIIRNIKLRIKVSSLKSKASSFIRYPFDIEIILLLIISYIAVAVSGFSDSALGIWKAYFFEPVLVFILVLNVFGKDVETHCNASLRSASLQKILWPLTISAFIVSVFAIFQKFTGAFIFNELWAAEETRRVTSFFGYPNAVGLFLGPLVMVMIGWIINVIARTPVATGGRSNPVNSASYHGIATPLIEGEICESCLQLAARNDRLKFIFIGLTIILSILSIYFAKSEGALIAVAAGLIVFGLLSGKNIRWATVVLILVIGVGIMTYQPMRDYTVKKITLNDLSGQIRKQQWRETWQMLKDGRIITGAGMANYQKVMESYHQEGIFFNKNNDPEFHRHVVWNEEYRKKVWQPTEIYLYPHNILLNFWAELGLVGMLLFVWIIGKFLLLGARYWVLGVGDGENRKNYLVLGLICAMVVIVVHGIVDVPYFKNDLSVMFWLLAAMASLFNLTSNPSLL